MSTLQFNSSAGITQTGVTQAEQISTIPPVQGKITELARGYLSNNLPLQEKKIEQLSVRVLPTYNRSTLVKDVYSFLIEGYDKHDLVDNWVFQVLEASVSGKITDLKHSLAYLEHVHPENQYALLNAACLLAKKQGHVEIAQLLFNYNDKIPATLPEDCSLKFDRSKESSNLVRALSKNENPIISTSSYLFGTGVATLAWLALESFAPSARLLTALAAGVYTLVQYTKDVPKTQDQIAYDVIRFQLKQNKVNDACLEFNSLQTAEIKNLTYPLIMEKLPAPTYVNKALANDFGNTTIHLHNDQNPDYPKQN